MGADRAQKQLCLLEHNDADDTGPTFRVASVEPGATGTLQAATTDLTPTQLAWVSGYFGACSISSLLRLQRRQRQPQNAGYNYYLCFANRQCAPGC